MQITFQRHDNQNFTFFRKSNTGGPTYEMRWATAEDFSELKVMPRMFLDHFPDNIYKTLTTVLEQQKTTSASITSLNSI